MKTNFKHDVRFKPLFVQEKRWFPDTGIPVHSSIWFHEIHKA